MEVKSTPEQVNGNQWAKSAAAVKACTVAERAYSPQRRELSESVKETREQAERVHTPLNTPRTEGLKLQGVSEAFRSLFPSQEGNTGGENGSAFLSSPKR